MNKCNEFRATSGNVNMQIRREVVKKQGEEENNMKNSNINDKR